MAKSSPSQLIALPQSTWEDTYLAVREVTYEQQSEWHKPVYHLRDTTTPSCWKIEFFVKRGHPMLDDVK